MHTSHALSSSTYANNEHPAFRRIVRAFLAGCSLIGLLLLASARAGAMPQVIEHHVPAAVQGLAPMERMDGAATLRLTIGLPLRNQAALDQFLQDLYDPASPKFHQYLTPEEFTARFGPAEQDYQTVLDHAKAAGLTVTGTSPNRLIVEVSGPVVNVEKLLHVNMQRYQHPTQNRIFYAPDRNPTVDLGVPILGIGGLNNYYLTRPQARVHSSKKSHTSAVNAGSSPGGGYMGNDFRAAYAPGVALDGSGQSVGLVEFDGYDTNDIAFYESQAGLPSVTLSNVLLDGYDGTPFSSDGQLEVSLDIEMAISMAPGLSSVIVYQGPPSEQGTSAAWHTMLNRMATDNLAKQLSCSWFIPGAPADSVADTIFQQMAAQGQSFFNASGDSDAYAGLIPFPGDTPYITQVGGTTLTTTGPGGAFVSETVWNWGIEFAPADDGIGSSGGISTQYTIPAWQTNVATTGNQGSKTMRNVPDVALTSDNIYVRSGGRDNEGVGGTSAAAPLWAAFTALANQQAALGGKSLVGFANPALYAIGKGTNYSGSFHDVTNGANTWSGSTNKFFAKSGYDLCTGWGSPSGVGLINALVTPSHVPPSIVSQPQSQTIFSGTSVSFSVAAFGPIPFTYQWTFKGTNISGATASSLTLNYVQASQAGAYAVKVSNAYGSVTSSNATLTVQTVPPAITMQPASQTVFVAGTATFNVSANGSLPFSYQWTFNGSNISGATASSLTLNNVQPSQAGAYAVKVSNSFGSVTSSNATLTVQSIPPSITMQPASTSADVGTTATFSVTAAGSPPLSYQWRFQGTNISHATNNPLTLSNVQLSQAGAYSVQVSSPYGSTTSSNATLTVVAAPPSITGQPASQIVLAGGAALFSVSATGALPLSYQWRFNGATISGATFPTLNLSGVTTNQAGAYSVRITNAFGSVISSNATLTVVPVPGYTNLHSFVGNIAANPQAPFLVSSNTLYGTTAGGGSGGWGAVYKMGTNGSSKTTLHNFSGPDGMTPVGSLLLSGSTLYGATSAGGANGSGTIFKVNTDGSGFATLYSFSLDDTGTNSDGAEPNGGLVISGSTLYGTTGVAGPLGWGTLFKISTNGTGFAIVHTFTSGSDGSNPNGGLVLSGSTLYGAAGTGGANNVGTIFKVKTDGTGFTTVHTFSSPTGGNPINTEGYNPQGNLLLSGNTLYGTTPIGGANGEGTIYSVQTNGSGLTVVHTFTAPNPFTNADGAIPSPGLVLTGGKLYGTAQQAGFNAGGTIFSVKTNGSSFTTIYNFSLPNGNAFGAATNSDGLTPLAGLALSGSTLFGTASAGGTAAQGTAFSINTSGGGFANIHTFGYSGDGADPGSTLLLSGGVLYGATPWGGSSGLGTVFKIGTNATGLSTLHSFTGGSDGAAPSGRLVASGNVLFGTTAGSINIQGDDFGYGTVFKINNDGTGFTTLYTFTNGADGAFPSAGLVLSGATLYGTAAQGGGGVGTVFKVTTNGTGFKVLHSFNGESDGTFPVCDLVLSGGTLFGTSQTAGSGTNGGTVFSVSTNGAGFTILHAFGFDFSGTNADGIAPQAGLTLSGSTLYGTASSGGSGARGTIFSLSTNGGAFTTLYNFTSDFFGSNIDGSTPTAPLIISGNTLYGTATRGGSQDEGTVFQLNTDGTGFVTLHSFGALQPGDFNPDGTSPSGGLVLGGTKLYGTAGGGGAAGQGCVFEMDLTGSSSLALFAPNVASGIFAPLDAPATGDNNAVTPASNNVDVTVAPNPPANVTVSGSVRNTEIPWTQGLTLARAIVAADYTGADDPTEIIITRNGEQGSVDPQALLQGADVPLEAGDAITIR